MFTVEGDNLNQQFVDALLGESTPVFTTPKGVSRYVIRLDRDMSLKVDAYVMSDNHRVITKIEITRTTA